MFTYSLLAGLLFGLYFSLIGLGLNLVFGVMRIVNLAHGDFLMLGAFLAFWLFTLFAINPGSGDRDAFVGFVLVGWPLYYLLVPRLLRAKDPEMLSFILFFGLSQVIEAVTTIAFGTSERSIPGDQLGRPSPRSKVSSPGTKSRAARSMCFGQTFPASWVASGIASGVRRPLRLSLSLPDAARLSDARGHGQSRGGDRRPASMFIASPRSPSASASASPRWPAYSRRSCSAASPRRWAPRLR